MVWRHFPVEEACAGETYLLLGEPYLLPGEICPQGRPDVRALQYQRTRNALIHWIQRMKG